MKAETREREARWISTGRGRGSRRGAEGEEAAGGAGGERVEVAPRGSGARRRREQRGVAGGVENQRAARLVRHGRARLGRLLSSPLRRDAALCSAGPHVGLSPDFHNTRRGRGPTCLAEILDGLDHGPREWAGSICKILTAPTSPR